MQPFRPQPPQHSPGPAASCRINDATPPEGALPLKLATTSDSATPGSGGDSSAGPEPPGGDERANLPPGSVIGECTIEEVIGEGGSSVVYRAQQAGLDRRVAVKVLRSPAGSRQARWRFALEARVLARLDHPSIARVHGSGVSGDGRPYLVMEYIDGRPITEEAAGLAVRERVRLFLEVCEAVQAAHRMGIIHRDIKPSNVLVERGPDELRVKLLDFGIARVSEEETGLATAHTHAGALLGTAAYMSPEQAAGHQDEVGTTSDVFSLGVLLFELLTGRTPRPCFGGTGSASVRLPLDEQLRRLRTEPAPPLSRFDRTLRGDLETIVARALELSASRRYHSPGELRADLSRWLERRPIEARRPGAWYRARMWVRRNRAAAAAIAVIGVLGAFGLAMAVKARHVERREYESALSHYALLLDRLVDEAGKRAATREFRLGILQSAAADIRRDLLRRPDDPRLQALSAQSISGIGTVRLEEGKFKEALYHQERALELLERVVAARPDDRAARLALCTQCVRVGDIAGRENPVRRRAMYERAHGELVALCEEDPGDAGALEALTWSHERLAVLTQKARGSAAALPQFREQLAAAERLLALRPGAIAAVYARCEALLQMAGSLRGSLPAGVEVDGPGQDQFSRVARRSLDAARQLVALAPEEVRSTHVLVRALGLMASLHGELGEVEQARMLATESLSRAERLIGLDPQGSLPVWCMVHALDSLWQVHARADEPEAARRCMERQIAVIERTPGHGLGDSDFAETLLRAIARRDEAAGRAAAR